MLPSQLLWGSVMDRVQRREDGAEPGASSRPGTTAHCTYIIFLTSSVMLWLGVAVIPHVGHIVCLLPCTVHARIRCCRCLWRCLKSLHRRVGFYRLIRGSSYWTMDLIKTGVVTHW